MKLKTILATALSLALCATAASAYHDEWYYGDWAYDNNVGGSEFLVLNDYDEGFTVEFYGVGGWCDRKGASYATMRQVIASNGDNPVNWRVDSVCGNDNYARVCVTGGNGREACSTYGVADWWLEEYY